MREFEAVVAEALEHHKAGRLAEAGAAYARALVLSPEHPAVLHNIGTVQAAQGDHVMALASFDRVVGVEPGYAAAHYNRGVALEKLGRAREAIEAFRRAVALEPGNYDAHRALGFLWLAEGERGRALDHFARTYELRRGEDRTSAAARSLDHSSKAKLSHDAGLFRYLASEMRDGRRFELLARIYEQASGGLGEGIVRLSGDQLELLGEDYNTAINIRVAPELSGPAINPALDAEAIAQGFADERAVAIDDLLTPQALAGLGRNLLESTIWHDFSHIGGFVATYLEDGLASPLLLQVADELRGLLPAVLGAHPLTQAWAFKGLEGHAAVDAHADDAAISLNLWLTPDAANLEPGQGGLAVCRRLPPADWAMAGYDADKDAVRAFLEAHAEDLLRVPYLQNRAVMFDARLFHRSDAPRFQPGHANHRINLTLLYGRRGGAKAA